MATNQYRIRPVSKVFITSILLALIVFAGITSYSAYTYQQGKIVLQCDAVLQSMFDLYFDKVYNLSSLYVPVFQSEANEAIMRRYFERSGDARLEYEERTELAMLLNNMMSRDSDIHFIALYNANATHNYCLTANSNTLRDMWGDLPLLSGGGQSRQQLLGLYRWQTDYYERKCSYVIQGGSVPAGSHGKIYIGYDIRSFERVIKHSEVQDFATFVVANESSLIYDSTGTRAEDDCDLSWMEGHSGVHADPQGNYWYTGVMHNTGRVFTAAYMIPLHELIRMSHSNTPFILLVLACFTLFALGLYWFSARRIFRRVGNIQKGLRIIGDNHLDYRFVVGNTGDEFDEIAEDINGMTERLSLSIKKEYELRVRETAAELNQVQARFNPHFLYNTLEVIRGRLFRSGDLETADYIEKLSRIFRNLTDAASVMSIQEEIAFCRLYMSLLELLFRDSVDVSFDVDVELQECGILSHLIQPAIENYFMHAMDETAEYHALDIICEPVDEDKIRITIADNGTGIDDERMVELNHRLHLPTIGDRGYGLMSIAKRIHLFYGDGYGVHLEKNIPTGMRVVILIPRMSLEEHQRKLGIHD